VDVARLLLLIALDFVSPKSMNAAKTQKPKGQELMAKSYSYNHKSGIAE
jgi:hypothetical protein